jgi:tetratricopeptide (TPR) repeat protein
VALAVSRPSAGQSPPPVPAARQAAAALLAPVPAAGETTAQLVDRLTAALRDAPGDPAALDNLAFAELQMAREDGDPLWYTKADRLFRRSLERSPNDIPALAGLGSLALSRHDFSGALRDGRRVLNLQPGSDYALGVVADANIELGRYAAARLAVQRMLDRRPDVSSYARASYLLELEGHVGAARRAMVAAVASGAPARENTAWAQVQLANLDLNHGRFELASREYAAALRTYPGFVHALAGRARLAAALGHYTEAAALYRRVVDRYPLPAYVIALGETYQAEGASRRAARTYALVRAEEALYAANGVNVDAELALFEADHGDPAAALAAARSVAAVQRSVTVEDVLAWALFKSGHPAAALSASDRALALGTQDATMLFHRGAIESALGRNAAAHSDLTRALAINPRFSPLHAPVARRLLETTRGRS